MYQFVAAPTARRPRFERRSAVPAAGTARGKRRGDIDQLIEVDQGLDVAVGVDAEPRAVEPDVEARQARGQGVARYLDSVDAQADTLDGMIEELLFYSRLEAAPYELRPESLRPRELVEAVTGAHEADALARDVSVEAAFAEVPAAVRADRRLLLRALGNVLRNAIAYTPNGATVRIEVTAHEGRLRFSVTDEGPGVAVKYLEQIFLPFVRTDTARTRSTGGVGLGLAIARRCMEAHGGGATAEPAQEGSGLTVHLWLPLAPGGDENGQ